MQGTWGRIWQNAIQAFVMVLALAATAMVWANSATSGSKPIPASNPGIVLVYGDSLSAAYNLAAEQGWVHWLGQQLQAKGLNWQVRNASVSGETTDGGLRRLAPVLDEVKPRILVLELGANDGLRGLPLTQSKANLAAMIEQARARDIDVLLVGMEMPPNYGPEYTAAFRGLYADLAKQYELAFLPFLLAPIADQRENFLDDNLHPTAAAQPAVGQHVLTALLPLLSKRP